MTGLFLDVSEYAEEPIEVVVAKAIRLLQLDEAEEDYIIIRSSMNGPRPQAYHTPPRDSRGKFIKEQRHVSGDSPAQEF